MWSSAFLLLDEVASELHSGLHLTESHSRVSQDNSSNFMVACPHRPRLPVSTLYAAYCCIMPKKLFPTSLAIGMHLGILQDVDRLTHPQQCLLVRFLLLAGLHKACEPGMLLHSASLRTASVMCARDVSRHLCPLHDSGRENSHSNQ